MNAGPRAPVAPRRTHRAVALLLSVALVLVALAWLAATLRASLDPLARAEQERQAARAALLDAQLSGVDVWVAAAWKLVPLALVGGAGVVARVQSVVERRASA